MKKLQTSKKYTDKVNGHGYEHFEWETYCGKCHHKLWDNWSLGNNDNQLESKPKSFDEFIYCPYCGDLLE